MYIMLVMVENVGHGTFGFCERCEIHGIVTWIMTYDFDESAWYGWNNNMYGVIMVLNMFFFYNYKLWYFGRFVVMRCIEVIWWKNCDVVVMEKDKIWAWCNMTLVIMCWSMYRILWNSWYDDFINGVVKGGNDMFELNMWLIVVVCHYKVIGG